MYPKAGVGEHNMLPRPLDVIEPLPATSTRPTTPVTNPPSDRVPTTDEGGGEDKDVKVDDGVDGEDVGVDDEGGGWTTGWDGEDVVVDDEGEGKGVDVDEGVKVDGGVYDEDGGEGEGDPNSFFLYQEFSSK
ncbi:hypothetical protein L208DRAFT_1377587 [Tricholoma matsutake]|nr:hypothetical protein L208DRAFT_1377587 [Tricholoma matsutake 945]